MTEIADFAKLRLELSCEVPAFICRKAVETPDNLLQIDCNLVQAGDESGKGVGVA